MTKLSILIPTFRRTNLLKWGLLSLSKQTYPFPYEIIVLNDGIKDDTEEICNQFKDKLNIRYIFTGQRNRPNKFIWRCPGYAINIGIKHAKGEIIIITCPEMFILDDCISQMVNPILKNSKLIITTKGKFDHNYKDRNHPIFLPYIEKNKGIINKDMPYNRLPPLQVHLPFFMGIAKKELIEIGGYDEDLTGYCFDDNDIVDRLKANGCRYHRIEARVVHLYHPRHKFKNKDIAKRWQYNKKLYEERKGIIVRNKEREWGKINDWQLNNIPKIAHFYWGEEKLPFLRYLTIYSFWKLNPDWEINFYYPKIRFEAKTWSSPNHKFKFVGKNYYNRLKKLAGVHFHEINFESIQIPSYISEVFKSDYFRWYLLGKVGGLWSDMDIIYFKSMNHFIYNQEKFKDSDTFVCINPRYRHSIGFMFSSENNDYYRSLREKSLNVNKLDNYQSLGVLLLNKYFPTIEIIKKEYPKLNIRNIPMDIVYPYDAIDKNIRKIYNNNNLEFTENTIGLHWFAGHGLAYKYINEVTEENYKNYNNILCQTIGKSYET